MNSITIAGNIGKDCEVRYLPNGDPIANFSVADSQGKDKPPIWWRCSLYGKRAESLSQYLTKGQQVTVVGQVTEREWTDKDGAKKVSMDVRVQDIALQGGKKEQGEAPRHASPSSSAAAQPKANDASGFDDMSDDVPF